MKPENYNRYLTTLQVELVPAFGCTEPIAIAYAAAKARELLGSLPDRIEVRASGSIIKNVKSVIVPNTGHMKGTEAACAAGVIAGDADAALEVLTGIREEQIPDIKDYMESVPITVSALTDGPVFNLIVSAYAKETSARVQITDHHTQIVLMEKNGETIFQAASEGCTQTADRSWMNVEGIWEFVEALDVFDVSELFDRVISCNMAIAEEGLQGNYGANVGSTLLNAYGDGMYNRAKAYAAAGSDARMDGCELPVYINSGSGNQGIVCSVPVIICARELGVSREKLYRALALSNLIAIHEKTGIGTLSAYCGAVSAGAAAGAAIAYLSDGGYKAVTHTIVNAVAIDSGMICDGAKASCAAKIASAVDAGIFGYLMYKNGQEFLGGDGIVVKGVENTIRNVGRLGRDGMRGTNEEIIRMMTGE
ncbi:MAG: L-serine ammonia-lyase, iron-sulfur-dependent, subunit alpha [Lachnospiraceae bacterium]|nr:L-serine ammonia-lyase, iron-sulfur-dependent, subunit alpha [Lachnospiraceae bacterium]